MHRDVSLNPQRDALGPEIKSAVLRIVARAGGAMLAAIIIDSLLNPRDEQTAQQGDI